MATHIILIDKVIDDFVQVGNSMSTCYKFDGTHLYVEWKWSVQKVPAKVGDLFSISCNGYDPEVRPLTLPKRTGQKLLWIFGFMRGARAASEQDFHRVHESRRNIFSAGFVNYREGVFEIPGVCKLVHSNRWDCGGIHKIAGWITDDLTTDQIEKLYYQFEDYFGDRFYLGHEITAKLMREHFGIDIPLLSHLDSTNDMVWRYSSDGRVLYEATFFNVEEFIEAFNLDEECVSRIRKNRAEWLLEIKEEGRA